MVDIAILLFLSSSCLLCFKDSGQFAGAQAAHNLVCANGTSGQQESEYKRARLAWPRVPGPIIHGVRCLCRQFRCAFFLFTTPGSSGGSGGTWIQADSCGAAAPEERVIEYGKKTSAADATHPVAPSEADTDHEDGGGQSQEHAEGELLWRGFGREPGAARPVRVGRNEIGKVVGGEEPVARTRRNQKIRKGPLNRQETCERRRAENCGLRPATPARDEAAEDIENKRGDDQQEREIRRDEMRDVLVDGAEFGRGRDELENLHERDMQERVGAGHDGCRPAIF